MYNITKEQKEQVDEHLMYATWAINEGWYWAAKYQLEVASWWLRQ